MPKIYIIHENQEWTEPLKVQLRALGLPFEEWYLNRGQLDLSTPPPLGVFYNRMSASSHTRNHRYAVEHTAAVLSWLEGHDRRIINSSRALQLEISKVAQYAALDSHGIQTPRTVAAIGRNEILAAAQSFNGPFITKHNRGGKGLGVRLFQQSDALQIYVDGPEFESPIDGITLVQQYIESPQPYITRCEFVGGQFLYALRVDTSDGFLLCPADECQTKDAFGLPAPTSKFHIVKDFDHPILERYRRFLADNETHVAGIEFILDKDGEPYTYDINTNTNYNPSAEAAAGVSGMRRIAEYLGDELAEVAAFGANQRRVASS